MKAYDIESALLGSVLRWGKDAAGMLLPQLTADKFVFNFDGSFGSDHSLIWGAITEVFLHEKASPSYIEVARKLGGAHETELRGLVDRLEKQYKLFGFDAQQIMRLAELVDKQGTVYNIAHVGKAISTSIDTIDTFMQTLNKIEDVDEWATQQLTAYRTVMSMQSSGYTPISEGINPVKEKWERQFRGEELVLLENGFPSLMGAKLFPVRRMAVIHGLSSSGKSTLVFQINLGTAIGLMKNKIKGCVAINSLEMESDALIERMVAILARVDVSKFIGGSVTKHELDRLFSWADFVGKLPIYIDDTNFITTTAMEYRASGLHVSEHGPVLQLSSDYGELFKDADGQSEEQRVNKVFREQFRLSRSIGASVIAVSQSTVDKAISGKTYIAGPDGTRYSKGILQAADILLEIWNPVQMEASGRTVIGPEGFSDAHPWLFIQKYRNAKTGLAVPLGWDAPTTTFFDLSIAQTPGLETVFSHLDAVVKEMGHTPEILSPTDTDLASW